MPHLTLKIIRDEHAAVAGVLRSLSLMTERGPEDDEPERFFNVVRAMLFYLDEFPERLHHLNESNLLFPRLALAAPELMHLISRLEGEHMSGECRVRELQHRLLAWELLGEGRRLAFSEAVQAYVSFYLDHMLIEEKELLPVAVTALASSDWAQLDAAFNLHRDPLSSGTHDPCYDRLLTCIASHAPLSASASEAADRAAEKNL